MISNLSTKVLTDLPAALPLLRFNCELNNSSSVEVAPCTWGTEDVSAIGTADVVLACELIYKQDSWIQEALADTIATLLQTSNDGRCLFVYDFRGSMIEDLPFLEKADILFDCKSVALGDSDETFLYEYTLNATPN